MKTARDLMTSPAECLSSDETLVTAARMLSKYDIGSMPVVDGDELVGILTDRDIVIQGVSKGLDLSTATVGEIATSDVVTVEPDAGADAVAKLMSENQVRRLPVVENGSVIGVIAQADVARELSEDKTGEVVGDISKS